MNKLESFRKTTLNDSDLWYIESTVNFKMWATLEVLEIVRSFRLMRKTHRSSHPSHHLIQIQLVFGCLSWDRLHLQLLSLPSNMLTNHKTKLHMKPKETNHSSPKNPPKKTHSLHIYIEIQGPRNVCQRWSQFPPWQSHLHGRNTPRCHPNRNVPGHEFYGPAGVKRCWTLGKVG